MPISCGTSATGGSCGWDAPRRLSRSMPRPCWPSMPTAGSWVPTAARAGCCRPWTGRAWGRCSASRCRPCSATRWAMSCGWRAPATATAVHCCTPGWASRARPWWVGEARQAMVRGPQRRTRMSGATSAQADHLQAAPQGDVSALEALSDRDPKMDALISQARRLAGRSINMNIQGETGTGKEVLAQAIHQASSRADRAFVAINCAAIPESLIESELFGYLPGTFTGARSRGMVGLIQRADGGTLFLDEIGDMPLALQTRLLRVLAERELLPLGADKPIPLALTVLAASHRNLRERISAGQFREDL